jgi:hypothetical protein
MFSLFSLSLSLPLYHIVFSFLFKFVYYNIKMDLRETGIDGANWIRLAQVRV